LFDSLRKEAGKSKGVKPSKTGKSVFGGRLLFEADQLLEDHEDYDMAFNAVENHKASMIRKSFSRMYPDGAPFWIDFYE
jgi:hypothetical protein